MYEFKPISERVSKMRAKYRDTQPEICIARYKLLTEFYLEHPEIQGILKRAKAFRHICENIPVRIDEGEVILGGQSAVYRACALYPENSVDWLKDELESGLISTRDIDPYIVSDEDKKYVLDTIGFWEKECMSAKTDAQIVDQYLDHVPNGVLLFGAKGQTPSAVGHFVSGYDTLLEKGFGAIKEEAVAKMNDLIERGLPDKTIDNYNFYRAVSIVIDGMLTLTKRHAKLVEEKAAIEKDPERKKELEAMADTLNWCMEKPARNFHDAIQTLFMYHTCMCLDANLHAISFGRIDQYLGDYYEADIKSGALTAEYAQELMDLFYLKVAEINKPWSYHATQSNPGYVSHALMTLGGVKRDGTDATNPVSYMMLEASARLLLHDPPQCLRIHKGTPEKLWELAVEATKISGGLPSYENDDIIIPALQNRGLSLESARNYCCLGCVEPSGCCEEWASPGGTGSESYINLVNAMMLGINNGYFPRTDFASPFNMDEEDAAPKQVGVPTGYLYEMESIDEILDAVKKQIDFFIKWQAMNINSFEYIAREVLPLPTVSAAMGGCMEKGMDVMHGGARYNSTGMSGVGIGNIADSLAMIEHLCFESKKCTTRELYDALMANWEGYEDLHNYIKHEAPHYGNAIKNVDKYATWVGKVFHDAILSCSGPRGKYSAGLYPVTTNIMMGRETIATPDGRFSGEPLADGISPVQQMDTKGPTAILVSISQIDQSDYANGTLLNMKFHPTALQGDEGVKKLSQLIRAYFDMGGMQIQINVIDAKTLRAAQENPDDYKNLIVRVAGFSAYFVELHISGQEDLIRRTELAM